MPRSGRRSRPIVVDGDPLRWRVGDASMPNEAGWLAQLTVYSLQGGTSRLLVGSHLDSFYTRLYPPDQLMPSWVEVIIRRARDLGWDPNEQGADYRLEVDFGVIIEEFEEEVTAKRMASYRSLKQGDA